ncbi:MAG: alpha/beta hydrolase [Nitrospira sp.]|nr:alpha/beta hydrolase [Candidatus Manganitrophaceae bacterium]HIL34660.1 alpha/beta hydrolase [Candidatus Manganitrophaceae bacterium]
MEKKIELELTPGERTALTLAEPENLTKHLVILCHGFMSSMESSTNLALTEKLLSKGIATCRFDFFGHNKSSGEFQEMTLTRCLAQAEGILRWSTQQGYRKHSLVGSSFGGLIAILLAARHPDLCALALKCPVSDYPKIWQSRLGEGGMKHWQKSGVLSFATFDGKARLEYSFYEDLLKVDTYRDAALIRSPTLIVHGDADVDVPVDQSNHLFERLQAEKEIEIIPGAGHDFYKPDDFERMIARISDWLIKK